MVSLFHSARGFLLFILLVAIAGCASFAEIDQDRLNHPALDLKKEKTARPQTPLSQLNSTDGAQGGGCSSCAK